MGVLEDLATAGRSVTEQVGPSVVRIGRHGGRGCGIVIGNGQILTNAHNLRGAETSVTFADGRVDTAAVTGIDVDGDLAVLAVDTAAAPALPRGGTATTGDIVFTVTRSAAGGTRIAFGMVSGVERAFRGPRGRRISGTIEHTAPLLRGSSGSPVVDRDGRLVGINTNRLGDGFYLALPADADFEDRIARLAAGESPTGLTLGVALAPAHVARRLRESVGLPPRDGVLVRHVEDGSAAARAGMAPGDLVVEAGGRPIGRVDDLHAALDAVAEGQAMAIRVVRGAEELELTVTFDAS